MILTKNHHKLWDCAKKLKHGASEQTRSNYLEKKIGAVRHQLGRDGQQNLVHHHHKNQPPSIGGARQEPVRLLALHHQIIPHPTALTYLPGRHNKY